jgi:hypothetical protein
MEFHSSRVAAPHSQPPDSGQQIKLAIILNEMTRLIYFRNKLWNISRRQDDSSIGVESI